MTDLSRGLSALANSREAYKTADKYYRGTVDEYFSSNRIAAALSNGKRFYLNYSKVPVDARADRIEIAAVTVPEDDRLTEILQTEVWDRNDLLLRQSQVHKTALSLGDAYLGVWPGEDEGTVTITFQSPLGTRVLYSPDNPLEPEFAIKVWGEGGDVWRANLYYADRVEKYVSMQGPGKDDNWVEYTEEDAVWPIANPFDEVPIFHFAAHGFPYGVPVHIDAYGPQDAILKLNNLEMAVSEYASFPQRWALTQVDATDGGVDPFGDDFDVTTNGEQVTPQSGTTRVKGGPGEMQVFENIKQVGEFGTADPQKLLALMEFQIRAMAQTTSTPLHFFNPTAGTPSGESLRRAEAPLVKSVDDLKTGFTRPWSRALTFALKILGYQAKVDVRWTQTQSVNDKEAWDTAKAKLDAGIPKEQVYAEMGYTAEQIAAWTEPEATPTASATPDIKAQADAMGILIRAGVEPERAAELVGLQNVEFTGAVPTSLRLPTSEASGLEEQ